MMIGWEGKDLREPLKLIEDIAPAALIFFARNYPLGGAEELREQIETLKQRSLEVTGQELIVAIDNEGGTVKRLPEPFTQLPSAREQAKIEESELQRQLSLSASEHAKMGFNLNLAPSVDLDCHGFMGSRTFSADPQIVIQKALTFIKSFKAGGLLCCAKHFPGLGAAKNDPHLLFSEVNLGSIELEKSHIRPFKSLIGSGLELIMTSHCLYPVLDRKKLATFSPRILRLVRENLGFTGLVLTDDLEMGAVAIKSEIGPAALESFMAGHDLLLICRRRASIEEARETLARAFVYSREAQNRLYQSQARIKKVLGLLEKKPKINF
ncbi:MAG: beta-N-acetylhexosaminidase [Deltaproteobacteria bacterium]|jgi:beta-N-acetylhexosaminidase|nr:beta-N-acetylhexosaminidase [Deltaproteobacteria bacterium]